VQVLSDALVIGDSMARQFFTTSVHLNRRGSAQPVLDFGGSHDWMYEPRLSQIDGRSADRLRKLLKNEHVAPAPPSALLSFQTCASGIDLTRSAHEHGAFWPVRIILFAPVYWQARGRCKRRTWTEWATELVDKTHGTLPPQFRGPIHLVLPPLGNVRGARNITRALDEIIRPAWDWGPIHMMDEGVATWSRDTNDYTNWHSVCTASHIRNRSLHFSGTRDGRCAETVNTNLLTQMAGRVAVLAGPQGGTARHGSVSQGQ
jgi:hypothetical protein